MAICPNGHESVDTDYCDVCGTPISATPVAVPPAPLPVTEALPAAGPGEPCPSCGEPHHGGRFCENCGYDFTAGGPVTPLGSGAAPVPAPVAASAWSAVVRADRGYYDAVIERAGDDADEVAFPPYCPERRFPLTGAQVYIGRRSASRGIRPDIDLTGPPEDSGVSHVHAVLIAAGAGWTVVDPGSMNGTRINDAADPIEPNVAVTVRDGDRIHVGAWTTITVTAG